MSEVWQKILLAAFLAISGCLVTYTLTTSSKNSQSRSPNEAPIAMIISSENEVQRRLAERLVWRRIFDNQYLYAGEALRTELDSTVTIQFIDQKTIVQLDPETVIEIERGEGGVNLDFLKGNLFVRSEELTDALTLSSGGKKLEIQNAEVSLAKAEASSELQVEVSKGSVKGSEEKQQERIELVSPLPRQIFYVNPDQKQSVVIQWKPIAAGYSMSLEIGDSPQRLSKSEIELSGAQGKVAVPLASGRYYFKLSAIDSSGKLPVLTSFTRRIELRPKLSPITLEPSKDSKVLAASDNPEISFRWANPGQLENLVVEYARSSDLRTDHASVRVKNALESRIALRWRDGEIFWRVSGTIPGTKDVVSSKIAKFTLTTNQVAVTKIAMVPSPSPIATFTPLPSPSPSPSPSVSPSPSPSPSPQVAKSTPTPKPKISAPQVDEAVKNDGIIGKNDGTAEVKWKPVTEAKQYQLQVTDAQGKVVQTTKVNGTSANLSNLKTGDYKVTLNSIDQAGGLSPNSSEISLKIPEYSSVRAPKIKSMTVK